MLFIILPLPCYILNSPDYTEQREYETIGEKISNLEQELEQLQQQENEVSSDYIKLQEIVVQKEKIETELENAMERWIYLSELAEEFEKSRGE